MYHKMTVDQVISQLYKRWADDGNNDCILAATSLLERVRLTVGENKKVSDAISIMNDVAYERRKMT